MQPSSSKTALLLQCPRPFDPQVEEAGQIEREEPSESMRYGSAFHAIIAPVLLKPQMVKTQSYIRLVDREARRFNVAKAGAELAGHVRSSAKYLLKWLEEQGWIGDRAWIIERSYAVAAEDSPRARAVPLPSDDEHIYPDLKPHEVGATVDLMIEKPAAVLVLDHKSGTRDDGFSMPEKHAQMRTLGLVPPKDKQVVLAVHHADRMGLPKVYDAPYDRAEQQAHARRLGAALDLVGSGYVRTGPECDDCPARATCPARSAEILGDASRALVEASSVLADEPVDPSKSLAPRGALSIAQRAGVLYKLLKKLRALDAAGMEEIRALVRKGVPVEVPGEGMLYFREEIRELLSKASIERNLPKKEAARLIEKLRKMGVVDERPREVLTVEKKG